MLFRSAGDEIAAVTSAGDLWLLWDGEEDALPAVIEEEENDELPEQRAAVSVHRL